MYEQMLFVKSAEHYSKRNNKQTLDMKIDNFFLKNLLWTHLEVII